VQVVNVYEDGDALPPHVDSKAFARPIVTVSLGADADMIFGEAAGRVAKSPAGGWDGFTLPLPRRSVLLLPDEACANDVEHCVPAVRGKRVSITLRSHAKTAR